mmetsp:Transcript_24493/g.83734  ORF Transcript_24493/g.83734 Transcript_24493/m.83734 type:complete len:98 (-) Transcript_24493:1617-1910(-)
MCIKEFDMQAIRNASDFSSWQSVKQWDVRKELRSKRSLLSNSMACSTFKTVRRQCPYLGSTCTSHNGCVPFAVIHERQLTNHLAAFDTMYSSGASTL